MNKTLLATMLALGVTVVSTTVMAFDFGVQRQGRGADDPVGHIRQGRGADDVGGVRGVHADGHISGRDRVRSFGGLSGGNSGRGNGMGAVGTTNPAGHVRGRGADDAVAEVRGAHADGHISGRDRVRIGGMGAIGLLGR